MLNFFYGTRLEQLAARLLKEMEENPPVNPLAPEVFVVQNHGIGQWLSLYMADHDGIAANMEFEFPSERIWKLIRSIDADIPQTLPSDRGPMTWSLVELLSDDDFLTDFDNLRRYIADEEPGQRQMRSWKLASKIADVFDQYLIYRPGMINSWEQQQPVTQSLQAERWQMQLWNRLIGHWQQNYEGEVLHRARLQQKLLDNLHNDTLDQAELPDRITVFGVSTASPAFIETIVKLSKCTEVYVYQFTVDPKKKESSEFDNPLLQSLAEEGASFMRQFAHYVKADRAIAKNLRWEQVEGGIQEDNDAFTAIQQDLAADSPLTGSKLKVPAADDSIQVHNCHSPMREVEVLYDQLLAMLDENPELHPDDILVMTPDIETYAPMIEAVFGKPDEGQPEIPYAIADRGIQGTQSATETFLSILELCESRFKITDVLDLLDDEPVQQAFGYSEEDLNTLERWIKDNRIRWGIDGRAKARWGLPESDHFSWKAGLQRILLGYMMHGGDDMLYDDIYAYDEVESSDDAELAGKFSRLLNELFMLSRNCSEAKSPGAWQEQLSTIVNTFLPDNRDYFREISAIRDALSSLDEQTSMVGCGQALSFSIVRRWLQEQLQQQSTGGGRIGRGVTFSSLRPMRSIPFDVIGMIGMNEGSFPGSKIPIEFDLMHLDPKPGDPVQSEQDRYLFLENLLSARHSLYFSYVGKSNRQDAHFPPSVVLKEFLDYLYEHYGLRTEDLVTPHRLQAFSPHYFKDEELFSYSQSQLQISRRLWNDHDGHQSFFAQALPEVDSQWKQLTVHELVSFFQHPARFLMQNRLGVYLYDDEVLTEDREPFAMNKLDEYKVGQELLKRFLKEQSLESYRQVMQSRDMLPEGWSGEQAFDHKSREVQEFGREIQQQLDRQPLEDLEVNLELNGFRITGRLSNIYRGALMDYRFGRARPKDKIEWWIRHLLFQQLKPVDHPGTSLLFSWSKGSMEKHQLESVEDTEEILGKLLELYWQGLQSPVQFYCDSSFAYAESVLLKDKDEEDGIGQAVRKWEPSWSGLPGEGDDLYNKLVTGGQMPFRQSKFRELSRTFWMPYFEALMTEER